MPRRTVARLLLALALLAFARPEPISDARNSDPGGAVLGDRPTGGGTSDNGTDVIDLAAAGVSPRDLSGDGFRHDMSRSLTPDAVGDLLSSGVDDKAFWAAQLAVVRLIQGHEIRLVEGAPDGPDGRVIDSVLLACVDAAGAASLLDLLRVTLREDGADVAAGSAIGDRSVNVSAPGGSALVVLFGRVLIGVSVLGGADPAGDAALAAEIAIRSVTRLTDGVGADVPGFGTHVARLGGAGILTVSDHYLVLDGEPTDATIAVGPSLLHQYELVQEVRPIAGEDAFGVYRVLLERYMDEDAAVERMATIRADPDVGTDGFDRIAPTRPTYLIGDESLHYSFTLDGPADTLWLGDREVIRVGAVIVDSVLYGSAGQGLLELQTYTLAQIDCLTGPACSGLIAQFPDQVVVARPSPVPPA